MVVPTWALVHTRASGAHLCTCTHEHCTDGHPGDPLWGADTTPKGLLEIPAKKFSPGQKFPGYTHRMSPIADLGYGKAVDALLTSGAPVSTVDDCRSIAKQVGCSLGYVKIRLKRLRKAEGGLRLVGPVRGRKRGRPPKERILGPPIGGGGGDILEPYLRDARDPVQRLELLNDLASNKDGGVPYAVQRAALADMAEEARQAGEGFGPPAITTWEQESERLLLILRAADPRALARALTNLSTMDEPISGPAEAAVGTLPSESDSPPEVAHEVETSETPPPTQSIGDADATSGVE